MWHHTNPSSNIWYYKQHKVSEKAQGKWMKSSLSNVDLESGLFSNRSGRSTLITRMAASGASGVPSEVGMLVSGHRTVDGYLRYDRTQALKIKAAQMATLGGKLTYEQALVVVTKKFSTEIAGNTEKLNPLVQVAIDDSKPQVKDLATIDDPVQVSADPRMYVMSDSDAFDLADIDWERETKNNPKLAKLLGGFGGQSLVNTTYGSVVGSTLHNCTYNITISSGEKENQPPT